MVMYLLDNGSQPTYTPATGSHDRLSTTLGDHASLTRMTVLAAATRFMQW